MGLFFYSWVSLLMDGMYNLILYLFYNVVELIDL